MNISNRKTTRLENVSSFIGNFYKGDLSDLGKKVAIFLDLMFNLNVLPKKSLIDVDWSSKTCIEFLVGATLSTVNDNSLTKLVVLAHEMRLRVGVTGISTGHIEIEFRQEYEEDKNWFYFDDRYQRCIKDHVDEILEELDFLVD